MNGPAENLNPLTSVRSAKVRTGIKKRRRNNLTQEEVKRRLNYNPETGVFVWINDNGRGRNGRNGKIAGSLNTSGYIEIRMFDGKLYFAHRLAWCFMEGYYPEFDIDHKNGKRHDNRWENLRHVSHSCNLQNQKKNAKNTSGFPGVARVKNVKKWTSYIKIKGKRTYIGTFDTPLEAALSRFTVEQQCSKWTCNYQSHLIKSILDHWPEFNINHLMGNI